MVFLLLLIFIYSIVVFYAFFGLFRLKYNVSCAKNQIKFSIIIAAKNEENNIKNLINSILNQKYSNENFEIIIVNDNSNDKTFQIVYEYIKSYKNITLLNLQNSTGKKNALKFGISKAKEDLIILTDADCRVGENWLKSINDFYQNTKPVMIIAPLVYLSDNKLFTIKNFLVLESYSHIGMTAGFAGMKNPIMCNGANLIFEKKIFYELEDPFCDKYISGDDMFFMLNVKKKYRKKILYLNNLEAVVETDIKENLKDFFLQRIRWASKAGGYKDFSVNFTGIVILLMNYSIFGLFLALFFKIIFLKYFLILFFSKFFIDFLLITKVAIKYKNFKLLIFYLPLQLIYFFYVFWVSFFSQIKKINWKKM